MGSTRRWRHVATLLLLFAAADVLVPGLCLTQAEQVPVVSGWAPGPSLGDELDSQHDDCFCCCGHVIPELLQSARAQQFMVEEVAHVLAGRVDLSPAPLYRPPRAL